LVGGVVLIISTPPNHNVDIIKQTPLQNMKDVRNLPPIRFKAAIKNKKDMLKYKIQCETDITGKK